MGFLLKNDLIAGVGRNARSRLARFAATQGFARLADAC
jgi:hypothetical protein